MILVEELSELHRRAALLAFFQLDWLIQDDPVPAEEVESFVLEQCERVVGPGDRPFWSLTIDARKAACRELQVSDLLDAVPPIEGEWEEITRPIALLRRHLDDSLGPIRELDDEELVDLSRIAGWFDGSVDGLPTTAALQQELDVRAHLAPLAGLLADGFYGRKDVLADFEEFLDDDGARPRVVYGPGGSGKSTLLARVALDDDLQPTRLVVYITFDRRRLRTADPGLILDEFLRQIGLQHDLGPGVIDRLREIARRRAHHDTDIASRSVESEWGVDEKLLDELGRLLGDLPILFLLDTFEEVQRSDRSHVRRFWTMLDSLRARLPGLRTVVAGRAPVAELDGHDQPLGEFDDEAATAYLRHLLRAHPDVDDGLLYQVMQLVGKSPLSLRLGR